MIRTGNRYLRYYLVEAANSVQRNEPEYKIYYQKKYKEVPKHQHKRALVLTARNLVRLVVATQRKYTRSEGPWLGFLNAVSFR